MTFTSDAPGNAPDDTNSAVFDGATTFGETVAPLNLSSYSAFTIEWFLKSTQSDVSMICELSPNFNYYAGRFYVDINETGAGSLGWASDMPPLGYVTQRAPSGFPQDGLWHHYAVSVNTLVSNLTTRLEIWLDGILQTNVTGGAGIGTYSAGQPLFIGCRGGNELFFSGQLDDLRISEGVLTPDQFLIHAAYTNAQLTITSQPASVTMTSGGPPPSFQVGVSVTNMPGDAVLYQWQAEAPGSNQWVSIPGAILPSYTVPQPRLSDSGTQYRVIVTAPGGPSITSAAAILTINASASPTIAYYRFQPGNPGADSSGNGNNLSVSNMTFTLDAPANAPDSTNSAVFDGATTFAETIAPLNLSSYSAFTIEWFLKSTQSDVSMICELSPNFNYYAGTFYVDINETGAGSLGWASDMPPLGYVTQRAPSGFPQDGLWHHYAVSVNTLVSNLTTRLEIWLDGILQTNVTGGAGAGTYAALQPLFIGSRGGNELFFAGQLDDFRISQGTLTPDQFLIHLAYTNAQLAITSQPADAIVASGQAASFQVGVSVTNMPGDAVLYQWQTEAPAGNQWTPIPGAILPIYTVSQPQLINSGTQYRVIVTAPGGPSISSEAATLFVGQLPPVSIAFTNGTLTLTWSSGILQQALQLAGPWQDLSGTNSPYSLAPIGNKMFFRLRQ